MSPFKCTVLRAFHVPLLLAATALAVSEPQNASASEGDDRGYIVAGPKKEMRNMKFKDGQILISYHQKGTIVSEDPASPWHHATFFAQGSIVENSDDKTLQEVALCETTDADGDLTWSTLWRIPDQPDQLRIVMGTGKWDGIVGSGTMSGEVRPRLDKGSMPKWNISWAIDHEKSQKRNAPIKVDDYEFHDQGLSFHGPHVTYFSRDLDNGLSLIVNSQSGVLRSDDPSTKSPRNYATCFDRGTTVSRNGKVQGDVMLLEDTDADGDIVWLCHIWWYGKGPGSYDFLGGTGKWKGITGRGTTRGSLRERTDDHFMLKSEMHWNIVNGD